MPNQYIDYYNRPVKNNLIEKGIGLLKNTFIGQGLRAAKGIFQDIMPMNQTAIMNNEMLGQGFAVDNIGRIVRVDQGDPNTAGNIMAGYNVSKMDEDTFEDRLNSLGNMSVEGRKKRRAAIKAAREAWRRAKIKTGDVYHDKYKDREDYRMLDTKYEDWEKEKDWYGKSDEQKLAMTGSEAEWGNLSDPNNPLGPEPDPNNYGFDNSGNFTGEGPGPEPDQGEQGSDAGFSDPPDQGEQGSDAGFSDPPADDWNAMGPGLNRGGRVYLNLGGLASILTGDPTPREIEAYSKGIYENDPSGSGEFNWELSNNNYGGRSSVMDRIGSAYGGPIDFYRYGRR